MLSFLETGFPVTKRGIICIFLKLFCVVKINLVIDRSLSLSFLADPILSGGGRELLRLLK